MDPCYICGVRVERVDPGFTPPRPLCVACRAEIMKPVEFGEDEYPMTEDVYEA